MSLVLLGSVAAVLAAYGVGTVLVLVQAGGRPSVPPAFWGWFFAACSITAVSLGLRAVRWVFLLRRAGVRIPIRDAYIGYFSGLSVSFVPLLIGEVAVRASVYRTRNGIPPATTCVVNLWERSLDLVAVAAIFCWAAWAAEPARVGVIAALLIVVGSLIGPVRSAGLSMLVWISNRVARAVDGLGTEVHRAEIARLAEHRAWSIALATSVTAWSVPAIGLWGLSQAWDTTVSLRAAEAIYSRSGGLLIGSGRLVAALASQGIGATSTTLTVIAAQAATAGVAIALGLVFVSVHLISHRSARGHFDALAPAYDAQIPRARRRALVARKTDMMTRILTERSIGLHGLDVGCGQGWYVARMAELGFDIDGIDDSAGQVAIARQRLGDTRVRQGSTLAIPAAQDSFDFVYAINVLHHLESVEEQRAAFAELERVLRPGGLLFLHEINTRNVVFRFYMGYVFPSLNCLDEGDERWLLPHRLSTYTRMPVVHTEYFTFLPEFLPAFLVRALRPVERLIELSPLTIYAAHYMAAFEKSCRS